MESTQQPHGARDEHNGQYRYRTFPSLNEVLLSRSGIDIHSFLHLFLLIYLCFFTPQTFIKDLPCAKPWAKPWDKMITKYRYYSNCHET